MPLREKRASCASRDDLGDAEVDQLDQGRPVVALDEEHVRGLQVAVDDARGVGLLEARAPPARAMPAREDRVEALAPARARAQVLALEQLHDEEQPQLGVGPDVEHVDDVLALDGAGAAGLALEARRRSRRRWRTATGPA